MLPCALLARVCEAGVADEVPLSPALELADCFETLEMGVLLATFTFRRVGAFLA